jgi:hypothetical protein
MYQRKSRRTTFTSWILSLLLNALLLCLLALLTPQSQLTQEIGLQAELFSAQHQAPSKPRLAVRPRLTRPSQSISVSSTQSLSSPTPAAVPLTTHARYITPAPNEPTLTSADEPVLTNPIDLSLDLAVPRNVSIQNAPMTGGGATSRSTGDSSVHTPRRAGARIQKSQGEAEATPQAQVRGSGQEMSGYYDIATVQYEDTADAMRGQALSHLALAMNRWTKVRTRLLPGSTPLADPAIQRIPLVYIAARSAFAFSEEERANLRTYLQNGGTLLFSDISPEWGIQGPVANSIRFELWKILGENAQLRPIVREDTVCASFFKFKKGVPLEAKGRGEFYALWLNGRIAVFYDAAGLGLKWMEDKGDEKWLQWGVNLIVYTLVSTQ